MVASWLAARGAIPPSASAAQNKIAALIAESFE
jgi:hypothetical protein